MPSPFRGKKNLAVTLKDIADRSGVSMKTVSRVLNNEPNVSDDTRSRVEEAATHLGYRPNLAAKGLASSRSFLIAMLYDDVSTSYVLNLMDGATQACRKAGYHLLVEPVSNAELSDAVAVARLLRRLNVDGLILTPPLCDNLVLLDSLTKLGMTAIRLSPFDAQGDHPVIKIDNYGASVEVTQHLMALGHERIGFIKGIPGHSATHFRYQGYRDALAQAGVRYNPDLVVEGDFTWRTGREGAAKLMSRTPSPTAIFASNDDMAAGVLSWMGQYGRRAPSDIAVVGFDDTSLSRLVYPALTTVGQDVAGMGHLAAQLIIDGETSPQEHRFAHELIVRESTDSAPT